jgi:hypothetical protein
MNFKSQIATSRVQSERLLSLGLKKETADMMWWSHTVDWCGIINEIERQWHLGIGYAEPLDVRMERIPAWSLHRLIEMAAGGSEEQMIFLPDPYDELIEEIAGAIMVGCFPKEYLV